MNKSVQKYVIIIRLNLRIIFNTAVLKRLRKVSLIFY